MTLVNLGETLETFFFLTRLSSFGIGLNGSSFMVISMIILKAFTPGVNIDLITNGRVVR